MCRIGNSFERILFLVISSKARFKLVFEGKKNIVPNNGICVRKDYATEGLFKPNVTSVNNNNEASSFAYTVDSYDMWHGRLGHVFFSSIKNMMKICLIPKLDFQSKACEVCV